MTSAENTALADVDQVSEHEWDEVMSSFLDANVYQTWAYGSVRWGEKNLSHLVVRRGSVIIGAAQLRILRVPVLGRGIAYLRWGPMWRGRGHELDPQGFRETVRALRQEYAVKRRLLLRVMPRVFQTAGYAGDVAEALQSEQFVARADIRSYRTFVLDLSPSLDDLRSSFEKQWRKHLRQAEENGLTLVENGDDRGFHQLIRLYEEMLGRKQFESFVDVRDFAEIQRQLPDQPKLTVVTCLSNGAPVSAAAYSILGDTALCLLAATSEAGRSVQSSYLVKWRTIQRAKEAGARWLDLGGRDPVASASVDKFKAGMSGSDETHIGVFECSGSAISKMVVRLGESLHRERHCGKG